MCSFAVQVATYKGRGLLPAPRTDPYVRLSRIRLVWGFLCQGWRTAFFAPFSFHDPRGACHWSRAIAANHACIRLNHIGPTMKQSYASTGKAPRRRVHSPSGIAAIAVCGLPPPRIIIGYRATSASGAEPSLSFLVLHYCSRRRPQLNAVWYLPGRDQAPQRNEQLARERHDHCRLSCAVRPFGPRAIPPRQHTVLLEH
jgi:hypothetical protein